MCCDHNGIARALVTDDQPSPLGHRSAWVRARSKLKPLSAHTAGVLDEFGHYDFLCRCSATIAALTASSGELIRSVCSTATNRRFVLPSIGEDQA